MNLIDVTDIADPRLQIYKELRENKVTPDNSFIADSEKVVRVLLKTDLELISMLATPQFYEDHLELLESKNISKCFRADKKIMAQIVGYPLHHGVMLRGRRPCEYSLKELGGRILLLDGVSRLDNVGALCRTAACLGVDSLVYHQNSPHPFARRVIRVSAGHVHRLKSHKSEDILASIKSLKEMGYHIYGAETEGKTLDVEDVTVADRWVLVLGNEGKGISLKVLKLCDDIITIAQEAGIDSLNTAAAGAIVMHRLCRGK